MLFRLFSTNPQTRNITHHWLPLSRINQFSMTYSVPTNCSKQHHAYQPTEPTEPDIACSPWSHCWCTCCRPRTASGLHSSWSSLASETATRCAAAPLRTAGYFWWFEACYPLFRYTASFVHSWRCCQCSQCSAVCCMRRCHRYGPRCCRMWMSCHSAGDQWCF